MCGIKTKQQRSNWVTIAINWEEVIGMMSEGPCIVEQRVKILITVQLCQIRIFKFLDNH